MADSYLNSIFLAAQAKQAANKQAFEFRNREWGALNAFKDDTPLTSPDLANLKNAPQRPTEALFLKKIDRTTTNALACTPTGIQGGSGKQSVTWTTIAKSILFDYKQAQNNQYADMILSNLLMEAEASIWDAMDTAAITYLNANRTNVNAADGKMDFTWDDTNFYSTVTKAQEQYFYNLAYSEMKLNNYSNGYKSIHNTNWESVIRYANAQGQANSVDLGFQYTGIGASWNMYSSNNIVADGANKHGIYLIPSGALSLGLWVDPAYRTPVQHGGDRRWFLMDSIFYPGVKIQVMELQACADTSANGGTTQSQTVTYELSIQYSLNHAILSTAGETPIFKHNVAAA